MSAKYCRLGAMETYTQRLERCILQVKKKNRTTRGKRVNPFSICRRSVQKFAGKQHRKVRGGQPGYRELVARGAPKCR